MLVAPSETADPAFGVPHAGCTYRKRRAGQRLASGSSSRRRRSASGPCSYLFDGIDHPLRIARPGASTNYYYYELDLAGNVRGLRASGGASLGGYRYSAFGQTLEDTSLINQALRWKGRWFSPVAGGTYDVRARQWSPELGVFLSIDEYEFHDTKSTLWGWPRQNPVRFRDPSGRDGEQCGYFPGPECKKNDRSEACRFERCPRPIVEHCNQVAGEQIRRCIDEQVARGVPWQTALGTCQAGAPTNYGVCLQVNCPP